MTALPIIAARAAARPTSLGPRPKPAGAARRPQPAGAARRPKPAGAARRPQPAGAARRPRAAAAVVAASEWPGPGRGGGLGEVSDPEKVLQRFGVAPTACAALACEAARVAHPTTTTAQHALDVIEALMQGGVASEDIALVLISCPRFLSCPAQKVKNIVLQIEEMPFSQLSDYLESAPPLDALATISESGFSAGDFIVAAARKGELDKMLGELPMEDLSEA